MASVQFSIRMDPAMKSRLDEEARLEDRSAAYITQKALDAYLRDKEYLRNIVRDAEIESDKGVFISGETMHAWIESWDTDNELPAPKPDTFSSKTAA
jgi:predicted transcriptional regulator